jgi:hypothetical protein
MDHDTILPEPPAPLSFLNDPKESMTGLITTLNIPLYPNMPPELEQHLFHLASIVLQAIPLQAKDRQQMVSPTGIPTTMSSCLKNALFTSAVMFSTHPELFPDGICNLKARMEKARGFASKAIQYVNLALVQAHFAPITDVFSRPHDPLVSLNFEQFHMPDVIRSMLALAHFSYSIGEGVISIKLIRRM